MNDMKDAPLVRGEKIMTEINKFPEHIESAVNHDTAAVLPPLRRQWPQLGQELFEMEHVLTNVLEPRRPLTEREKKEQQEKIRDTIISQLYLEEENYSRDTRHLAFLLLKQGRAGIIVGNPYTIEKGGKRLELPYTGLEGYYAGAEKTPDRPGLTGEEIIQEEANIGAKLLKTLKKRAIEQNSWIDFIHLKNALEWKVQDIEVIRSLQVLWGTIVRRLHTRLYHCPEFEPTLTEQIEHLEQLPGVAHKHTQEEKQFQNTFRGVYDRLRHELEAMSDKEKAQEKQERSRREWIRASRLAEFRHFHDETYHILLQSQQGRYAIDIQDTSLKDATITETITLPEIPGRQTYPETRVHLTPAQLEGYLFLAKLGEVGGDPLARSVLAAPK
jgi:hypothetical protein